MVKWPQFASRSKYLNPEEESRKFLVHVGNYFAISAWLYDRKTMQYVIPTTFTDGQDFLYGVHPSHDFGC
jgi:hypothetical protein